MNTQASRIALLSGMPFLGKSLCRADGTRSVANPCPSISLDRFESPSHALVSAASSLGVLNGICVATDVSITLNYQERGSWSAFPPKRLCLDNEWLASRKHLICLIACVPMPGKCGVEVDLNIHSINSTSFQSVCSSLPQLLDLQPYSH
jgi:hypothetical protein